MNQLEFDLNDRPLMEREGVLVVNPEYQTVGDRMTHAHYIGWVDSTEKNIYNGAVGLEYFADGRVFTHKDNIYE